MHWMDGTWMFERQSPAEWRAALVQLSSVGGSIVLQFAPSLVRCDQDTLETRCRRPGVPTDFLPTNNRLGDRAVAQRSFYEGEDLFDGFPADTHSLTSIADINPGSGGDPQRIWRLVTEHDRGVDVVYGFGRRSVQQARQDWLLQAAAEVGVEVLLGMPALPSHPSQLEIWRIDTELLGLWRVVSHWWLSALRDRFGRHPAVLGFYQSFETDLHPLSPAWDGYRAARELIDTVYHPSARLAISPYAVCVNRPERPGHTAALIGEAVEACAHAGVDILIPQDGRGSGVNALFWNYERDYRIGDTDEALVNYADVSSTDTFGGRFSLSTGELYAAVREAVDRLYIAGARMTLWANVEGFEMDVEAGDHGDDPSRSPISPTMRATTRDRVDRAAMFAAAHCSRMISFMWDPFFTAPRGAMGASPSLFATVTAQPDRPLICGAYFFDSAGTLGIIIRGYNLALAGVRIVLTWYDHSGAVQTRNHLVGSNGWVDPMFGRRDARRPPRFQEIFVPFDRTSILPSWWIHLRPEARDGPGPIYSMTYS